VTTTTTFLPSSATTLNFTSCNPTNAGTVIDSLTNSYGCDSTVTKITALLPTSLITLNYKSCDLVNVGIIKDTMSNSFGCDSIVTKITSLAPSYYDTIYSTSCVASEIGSIVVNDTTSFGCDSITTLITVAGNNNPFVSVSGLFLIANLSNMSYQWLDCGDNNSAISWETNQAYIVTKNGDYSVEITDGVCVDTSKCVEFLSVGLTLLDFKNNIILYPNPTNGYMKVEMADNIEIVTIRVTNEMGQEIISKTVENSNFDIDLTRYRSGIYFMHLSSNGMNAVFKVIKND
jgi:hypothetical protein